MSVISITQKELVQLTKLNINCINKTSNFMTGPLMKILPLRPMNASRSLSH